MKISPARTAAFDVLSRIEADRAFSSVMLPQYEEKLDPRDRGLCHELVLGVLRRQIYLDRLIDELAKAKKLDPPVRIALRLGLYQLVFLETPQHAAVNESVELVVRAKHSSARSLVNAVLRRVTRETPEITFTDEIDRLSVETSHPRWLLERWIGTFGEANAGSIARANNERSELCLRIVDQTLHPDPDWRGSETVVGAYRVSGMNEGLRSLANQGRIYFQEEASQLVAASVDVAVSGRFLDLCAAPGGKTGMIAANHPKLSVAVAGDLHWTRASNLRENLERQHQPDVQVLQYDATAGLPFAEHVFDRILVDAPCTGTGTIRNNPEIRYFLSPDDVTELSGKQQQILKNASKLVKTGGRLVYSTCSLECEEGEGVIDQFLTENAVFTVQRPNVPDRFVTSEGFARTRPDRDKMDGFFIAVLENRGF